jgi:hypothetical protein
MKDSKLSFERALQKVHEEFGIQGFATSVSKREEAAHKQSSRLFWKFLKEQLRWPKCVAFIFFHYYWWFDHTLFLYRIAANSNQ